MWSVILLSSKFQVNFYSKESMVDCNFFLSNEYTSQRLGLRYDGAIYLCILLSVYTVYDFPYDNSAYRATKAVSSHIEVPKYISGKCFFYPINKLRIA